jgi:uncharacterized protein YdaT
MPWDYKSGDIPTSMKYLKPSIQKKAISIANHVLSSTGDEGKAIAIGISKAKSVYDKKGSLVKLAVLSHHNAFIQKILKAIKKGDKQYLVNKYENLVGISSSNSDYENDRKGLK